MADEHGRYEQLAVGHVLGGLEPADAAEFRSHLLECGHCRLRVAELRGIASDLAAAERDERARATVTTQLPRRVGSDQSGDMGRSGVGIRHVTLAAVTVVVLAGAVAFWNFHLRTSAATFAATAGQRGEVLAELTSGVVVASDLGDGIDGLVVVDDDQVAFSLTGIPPLGAGESLIAWLVDEARIATPILIVRPGQVDDGALAAVLDHRGGVELVIARERGQPGSAPGEDRVLRVVLRTPRG